MAETKYGKYVTMNPLTYHDAEEISAEMFRMSALQDTGESVGAALMCLDKPWLMLKEPHFHDFPQFFGFFGSDSMKLGDFDAEIELTLGGTEKHVITTACYVYVPPGLLHGPLDFKRIGKPVLFMDIRLTKDYVRKSQSGEVVPLPDSPK
jgi:hypothetical protein